MFYRAGVGNGVSGNFEMYAASRDSVDKEFADPVRLDTLSLGPFNYSSTGATWPFISRDWPAPGSKLYFDAYVNDTNQYDIYEVTWTLAGDANLDLTVDDRDYAITISNLGSVTGSKKLRFMRGDFDLDRTVDADDARLLISNWTSNTGASGDFDADGSLDVQDIDLLSAVARLSGFHETFDLNLDGAINAIDRQLWVQERKKTWFGDSNLDGQFDSTDLVAVFTAGQYEDAVSLNSTWSTGDWNGDGDFASGDLVAAFQDGGYDRGLRQVAAVPEPSNWIALWLGLSGLISIVRTQHNITAVVSVLVVVVRWRIVAPDDGPIAAFQRGWYDLMPANVVAALADIAYGWHMPHARMTRSMKTT
jgi:hypothetical protein